MEPTPVGLRIRDYRKHLGLSQLRFGEQCEIDQKIISNIESGRTQKVAAEYLDKIEKAFPELSSQWLRHGIGNMTDENRPMRGVRTREEFDTRYPRSLFGGEDVAGAEPKQTLEQKIADLENTLRLQQKESARQIAALEKDRDRLLTVVETQSRQIESLLQGKELGNQADAPGTTDANGPERGQAGFKPNYMRIAADQTISEAVIIAMYGPQEPTIVGTSLRVAV